MKVTWIGLGIMGQGMVEHLIDSEDEVVVFNRTQSKLTSYKQRGIAAATTAAQAVENADVVYSMLSTPAAVQQIFLGPDGALAHMKKGALWVDCSTVDSEQSRRCATACQHREVAFLEAPVAGTKPHAENGQLLFLVGGDEVDLTRVAPQLDKMGRKTIHVGPVGQAAALKLVINMMLAQSMVVFSEALLLGEAMGLDRDFLLEFIPNSVVAAPFTKFKAEMILKDDYEVQFPLEWMHKDLQLATQEAYPLQPTSLPRFSDQRIVCSGEGARIESS